MIEIVGLLEGLNIATSGATSVLKLLKYLRANLGENALFDDPYWDEVNKHSTENKSRKSLNWKRQEALTTESPKVRAAFECFEKIYLFIKEADNSRKQVEKVYFSSMIYVIHGENDIRTDFGSHLSIRSDEVQEKVFNKIAHFIHDIRESHYSKNERYKDYKTVLVLSANIMDNIRCLRSEAKTSELVAYTALTLEVLRKVGNTLANGKFIKVQPGIKAEVPFNYDSLAFITARWPEAKQSLGLQASIQVGKAANDFTADYRKLIQRVNEISLIDGVRNIIMLGETGSGKSHTANLILDELTRTKTMRFQESRGGSMTSFVDYLPLEPSTYKVWDTPGLNDGYKRDTQFINEIESALLDMGTVSAIILCFQNFVRINQTNREIIRKYSTIVGPALQQKLLVVVNRSPEPIEEEDKSELISAFKQETEIDINTGQIFDLGMHAKDLSFNRISMFKRLLDICEQKPYKAGYFEVLSAGLLELSKLEDEDEIEYAKQRLIFLSGQAISSVLKKAQGRFPLSMRTNDGKKFILANSATYKDEKTNHKFQVEHIFELPKNSASKFTVFIQTFAIKNAPISHVVEKLAQFRLVFADKNHDPKRDISQGLLIQKRKYRYTLVNVDEALTEDVRSLLLKSVGVNEPGRTVTVFQMTKKKKRSSRNIPTFKN